MGIFIFCVKEENDQIELIHKNAIMMAIKPIGKQICLSHHFILSTPKIFKKTTKPTFYFLIKI